MREGAIRKTLVVCMAAMVAAASLPLAWVLASPPENGNACDAELVVTGPSGPVAVLSGPLRNPRVDFRELRLAGPLPGVCGLGAAGGLTGLSQPASAAGAGHAGLADATLLALHCLLTV
jgi:hypothetical protein